jgi:hypothetical protein
MMYQKSTTRCVTKRACYRKRNSAFRLNATVPRTKSVTWMNTDVKVTAVQWCQQQKEFFADEIHRIRYQWDACFLSHKNPEQVALGKILVSGSRDILWCVQVSTKIFYIFSGLIQVDIHVHTVLLLAEHSGLTDLSVSCSKRTWSKVGWPLSVSVSSAVFSGIATCRSLVREFARDVHKQDL